MPGILVRGKGAESAAPAKKERVDPTRPGVRALRNKVRYGRKNLPEMGDQIIQETSKERV